MLTAFQCEVVAFATDGEIVCRDCAVADFEERGSEGELAGSATPLIRYTLDEMQSERNVDYQASGDWPEGCTDECEPFVETCGVCGAELGEPYHYGHADEDTDEGRTGEPPSGPF